MKAPHLPFSSKFNDNETLASYANGVGVKTGGSRVGGPKLCVSWKYALEAIINRLLLYFLVHDNRLLSMLELY